MGVGLTFADPAGIISDLDARSIPEPNSGCFLWTAGLVRDGYGCIHIDKRNMGAHRVAWLVHRGPISVGLQVCHRCDVRSCVNPAHMFLGTTAENTADRHRKGRSARGRQTSPIPSALTEEHVRVIRAIPGSDGDVARAFGVSASTIAHIRRGDTWRHA